MILRIYVNLNKQDFPLFLTCRAHQNGVVQWMRLGMFFFFFASLPILGSWDVGFVSAFLFLILFFN